MISQCITNMRMPKMKLKIAHANSYAELNIVLTKNIFVTCLNLPLTSVVAHTWVVILSYLLTECIRYCCTFLRRSECNLENSSMLNIHAQQVILCGMLK